MPETGEPAGQFGPVLHFAAVEEALPRLGGVDRGWVRAANFLFSVSHSTGWTCVRLRETQPL
jgi:hypothetical protein